MIHLHTARSAIARRRTTHKAEDAMTSAFHVVESLTADECAAILRETDNRPLIVEDADVVQMVVAKTGAAVGWKHCDLTTGEWKEGRGG